ADVEVCKAWHLCRCIELVDLLLEKADAQHARIHVQPCLPVRRAHGVGARPSGTGRGSGTRLTPAPRASSSRRLAKSCSPIPLPMRFITIWWTSAETGIGTFRFRAASR